METPVRLEGKNWPQILTIFVACQSAISNGILFSWPSPFITKIANDKINYNITEAEAALFPLIHPLFTIIFSLFVPALGDFIGRKYTVMLIAAPQFLSWILIALAKSVWIFYLSRVVFGLAEALQLGVLSIYLAEIARPKTRGRWANVVAYRNIGRFLVNFIGQNCSVRTTSFICFSFPVIFIVGMLFMPESPYYSIKKNKEDEAKKSLQFLRGIKNVENELAQIKTDTRRQLSERGSWKDLFCVPSNRKGVFISVFFRVSQQFSALSVVLGYTQFIFEKSGSSLSPETSSLLTTGLFAIVTLISGVVSEWLGRKKSYATSVLFCGLILLLLATYFYLHQNTFVDLESWQWLPVAGILLYLIFSAIGISPVPTLVMGEVFSYRVKAKGVGFDAIMLDVFIFSSNMFFYILVGKFGLYAPFLGFGIVGTVSSILACYIVPETKGKTLEEIQQYFKHRKVDETRL